MVKAGHMCFFTDFQDKALPEKCLNATFVVLIPKKTGALEVKDFRPISLEDSIYKILAKFLANRLKGVLGDVSDTQCTYSRQKNP